MSVGIRIRAFEAGHCVHPGFMVKPGLGLAPRKFPAGVAFIKHPKEGALLFDTGYHQRFALCTQHFPERLYALTTPCSLKEDESLKQQLATQGVEAEHIKHIVLSHFHGDHMAGLCDFPQANIHCHPDGYHFLMKSHRLNRIRKGYLKELFPEQAKDKVIFTEHFPLDLGDVLELNQDPIGLAAKDMFADGLLYLVALPGHAAGQVGLLARLQDGFIFFLADACWLIDNLKDDINPHWLTNIICDNSKAYKDTLKKLRTCFHAASNKVIFAPSHCQDTWTSLIQTGWIR